jgi:hypothetical protein
MVRTGAIGPEAAVRPTVRTVHTNPTSPNQSENEVCGRYTKHMLAQSILRMSMHALLSTTKSQKGEAVLGTSVPTSKKTPRLYYKD